MARKTTKKAAPLVAAKPSKRSRKPAGVPADVTADTLAAFLADWLYPDGTKMGVSRRRLHDLAQVNDCWVDMYESFPGGRARMCIGNRLRAKLKAGERLIVPSTAN